MITIIFLSSIGLPKIWECCVSYKCTQQHDERQVGGPNQDQISNLGWTMIEAPDTGLVLDVSKRDQKIILWKRPKKGEPRKDNQLFKVNIIVKYLLFSKLDRFGMMEPSEAKEKDLCEQGRWGNSLYC